MRICIYAGHTGGTGGGENHTAGVISLLKDYYDVTVMVDPGKKDWFKEAENYFSWDLSGIKVIDFDPGKIQEYDQFININHGMLLPPLARRNIILCFFPQNRWATNGYDTIIANSFFTKKQIEQRWQRSPQDIEVIYPPVDISQFTYSPPKKNQIMTIGRFFEVPDGNNKNHLFMIEAFKKLKDPTLSFVIVGGIQHEDYYKKVVEAAESDPRIFIKHDLTREEMLHLYAESKIYWHATGYETQLPSSMEHFGMVAIEALASGCYTIVHNSGGMPESGATTWETEQDLLATTERLLKVSDQDQQQWDRVTRLRLENTFSLETARRKLIDVIEKPIAIMRPTDPGFKAPQSRISVHSRDIRVGMIGDAPNITTGFGVVSKMFAKGFLQSGYEVTQIGLQDKNYEPRNDQWRVWRPGYQALSKEFIQQWLETDKPNVLWLNYDAGNIANWLNMLAQLQCNIPVVAYFPIEGFPVPKGFVDMARLIAKPVTYLKWGSDLMFEQSGLRVDWIPHGLDHAKFERFSEEHRQTLKRQIGWENKFVIGAFGRNKRTKQQPRIIETISNLKHKWGVNDIVLYLHCQPFEGHMMNGWNLPDIVEYNDVRNMVAFPPDNKFNQVFGIDYEKPAVISEDILNQINWDDPASNNQARALMLSSYSMIERYNMCDLFISVSQAEGFNLPLGEAMACGVPILCVNDEGSQREVADGAAKFIDPIEWDTWHIGTLLPIVSKRTLANEIAHVMANPEERQEMSDNSLKAAKKYTWVQSCDKMNGAVLETYIRSRA